MIALSIVFVAAEIVHARAGRPGLTARRPWLVAFVFGLLHGFGFAGALSEVGLPPGGDPAGAAVLQPRRRAGAAPVRGGGGSRAVGCTQNSSRKAWLGGAAAPYAIGTTAMFWLMQRLIAFGGR